MAERFSKTRLLDYLKRQEQKKAKALEKPMMNGMRQMVLTERMLIHNLIKKIIYNQFGLDL